MCVVFQVAFYAFPNNEQEVRAFANLNNRYHEASMANRNNDWEQGLKIMTDDRIKEMWQVGKSVFVLHPSDLINSCCSYIVMRNSSTSVVGRFYRIRIL